MNILPKKRWHVRTKENIARVRKDEAEAAEKEKTEQIRIENADREARLNLLKQKSKQHLEDHSDLQPELSTLTQEKPQHINFFNDLEHCLSQTNKEHDKEIKTKKEEYEKKIGYLTYLGQDTNEALGKKNWYEVAPSTSNNSFRPDYIKDTYQKLEIRDKNGLPIKVDPDIKDGEISWKAKQKLDPINSFIKKSGIHAPLVNRDLKKTNKKKHIDKLKEKHKHKKNKHKDKKEELEKLKKLRELRLKREQAEKLKTNAFLTQLSGVKTKVPEYQEPAQLKQKYNSQFNPELARQNYK